MTNTNTNTSSISKSDISAKDKERARNVMAPKVKKHATNITMSVFRYAIIICLSFMILYPLLRMLSEVLVHPYDMGGVASVWIPAHITFDNIKVAYAIMNYPTGLVYTTVSTFIVMVLQMMSAAFAGYAFARLSFKGSGILFGAVLLTIVVPTSVLMLPQYNLFRNFDVLGIISLITGDTLNLLGKRSSLLLLAALGQGLSGGLFVYIFRQFFRGLPKELEEAAYVDGAGFLRTFFGIVLPTAKPGFMTVGVLSFVWNWNDTYFPSLFNPTNNYLRIMINTLSAPSGGTSSLQLAIGNNVSKIPPTIVRLQSSAYDALILSVCSLLTIAPLIIFFLLIQRQFVEGVERSGIVG